MIGNDDKKMLKTTIFWSHCGFPMIWIWIISFNRDVGSTIAALEIYKSSRKFMVGPLDDMFIILEVTLNVCIFVDSVYKVFGVFGKSCAHVAIGDVFFESCFERRLTICM